MATFQNVVGKTGNMRKAVDWVIYPRNEADQSYVIIQADKRIAKVFLDTGKVVLSDGKGGHQGFHKLSPMLGSTVVDCPQDMLDQIKSYTPQVGGITLFG